MKRYALFSGDRYYPSGGWNDFVESFDERWQAIERAVVLCEEWGVWAHVIDLQTGKFVGKWEHEE